MAKKANPERQSLLDDFKIAKGKKRTENELDLNESDAITKVVEKIKALV